MNYLERNQKSLAWHMVQDPNVLLSTFAEWQAYLELSKPDYGQWVVRCEKTVARLENATQMAKGFSIHIARYCDDLSFGRAPGFKEAIELALEAAAPGKLAKRNFETWKLRVGRYAIFFSDTLEFHRVLNLPKWRAKWASTPRPPWEDEEPERRHVTAEAVSALLKSKNRKIEAKTLKNAYKANWGKPDGSQGRAETFDWDRIRPIVEEQFSVKFEN